MLTVGLTGSVASGKSTVARIWEAAGVPVVSADELARTVVEPGTEGHHAVAEAFGEDVLAPDGTLDREVLRARVFRSDDDRRRLEEILHPRIAALRDRWMAERRAGGAELAVAEIPLLYEAERADDVDLVVVVDASEEERLRRLVEERGLEPEEARRIMESQMDPDEKRRRADRVLVNDGTRAELEGVARAMLAELRELARAGEET